MSKPNISKISCIYLRISDIRYKMIQIWFTASVSIICVVYDLRDRRIPNTVFLASYVITFLILLIRMYTNFIPFFFLFLIYCIFILCLCSGLYFLRIIGGADLKYILFMFMNYFSQLCKVHVVMLYFLIFSTFFVIITFVRLGINTLNSSKFQFQIFNKTLFVSSKFEKAFFMSFFKFLHLKTLHGKPETKYQLKYPLILYNYNKMRFEVLVQLRPPLILVCLISFCLLALLIELF